jgi:hypothetical protein
LWKCERNVGEYNTIDLVKENTKKKTTININAFLKINTQVYIFKPAYLAKRNLG